MGKSTVLRRARLRRRTRPGSAYEGAAELASGSRRTMRQAMRSPTLKSKFSSQAPRTACGRSSRTGGDQAQSSHRGDRHQVNDELAIAGNPPRARRRPAASQSSMTLRSERMPPGPPHGATARGSGVSGTTRRRGSIVPIHASIAVRSRDHAETCGAWGQREQPNQARPGRVAPHASVSGEINGCPRKDRSSV